MGEHWPCFHRRNDAGTPRARESRAIVLCALILCMLFPSALFAQTANQPTGAHKEDSFEQLKKRFQEIQDQHHKEISDLKERLGLVEQRQSTLSDEIGQHIKVGAYTAVSFEDFQNRRTNYDGKLELVLSGNFHDRIRVHNEIELGIPGGTAIAEQAYVDLLLAQLFNLRAGVLLIPFGKYNLDHFDVRQDLTDRPGVARRVTPTTWSDLGFGTFGLVPVSDNVKVTYEIQVINGLTDNFTAPATAPDVGLRDARTQLKPDNNGDKAVVGRGTFKFFDQYEIGFSGYRGAYKSSSHDMITGMALDAEFKPRSMSFWEDFQFKGEFARFDIEGSTAPSSLWGYYAQINYHFWPSVLNSTVLGRHFSSPIFTLVGRYGYTKINTTASSTGRLTEEQYVVGLNYRPVEDYVIKTEYQFNDGQLERKSSNGFITSVAWIF